MLTLLNLGPLLLFVTTLHTPMSPQNSGEKRRKRLTLNHRSGERAVGTTRITIT